MAWTVFIESSNIRHVIPLDDEHEHEDVSYWFADKNLDQFPECHCKCCPKREYNVDKDTWLFIHSSFDGREALEWANEILK